MNHPRVLDGGVIMSYTFIYILLLETYDLCRSVRWSLDDISMFGALVGSRFWALIAKVVKHGTWKIMISFHWNICPVEEEYMMILPLFVLSSAVFYLWSRCGLVILGMEGGDVFKLGKHPTVWVGRSVICCSLFFCFFLRSLNPLVSENTFGTHPETFTKKL